MSVIGSNILAGASGQGGEYTIEESLRFNASQSSYLSWTPASAGNRKTWTWSGWVKRGDISANAQVLFGAQGQTLIYLSDGTNPSFRVNNVGGGDTATTAVLRDPSAWYHVVVAVDTTQATSSNRLKMYINGVQQTSFTYNTEPTLNADTYVNSTALHVIGGRSWTSSQYLDGYITEVNFIDGQTLDASSFGEFDATTGVWKPKGYTGTYGTNGFFLDFRDATSATTLGYDYSGNSNNWTLNNFNTTSTSTAYCSMTDTPTPYADGGNYATLNPLSPTSYGSLSNSNLKFTGATDWGGSKSTIAIPTTGKWYAEFTLGSTSSNSAQADMGIFPANNSNYYDWTGSYGLEANNSFYLLTNGSYSAGRGGTTAGGTVLQIAVDADAGKVWFGVADAWYDTYNTTNGNPSAGTNPSGSSINFSATTYFMGVKTDFNNWNANFGQRPFAYTPPTGFKALHTGNLPDSNIVDGSKYFDVLTYTGAGTTPTILEPAFATDFLWIKRRSGTGEHYLFDRVRGSNNFLNSSQTYAENDGSLSPYVSQAFTSTGATIAQTASGGNEVNATSNTYVAWNWKANGTGVSNTDGSITSTVSANPTAGFSVVTVTTNASGVVPSCGHGLGVAPSMIVIKARTGTDGWYVYHKSASSPATRATLNLNTTSAVNTTNGTDGTTDKWTVNSSTFGFGNTLWTYGANTPFVAYCFAEVEGYSKFGSYTGNGSSDGPFVFTNFRPAFVLIKRADAISGWVVFDTSRDTYNVTGRYLMPNSSQAESGPSVIDIDTLSNGFKLRNNDGSLNTANTYIYMAFAETDFAHALAR